MMTPRPAGLIHPGIQCYCVAFKTMNNSHIDVAASCVMDNSRVKRARSLPSAKSIYHANEGGLRASVRGGFPLIFLNFKPLKLQLKLKVLSSLQLIILNT